VPQESKESKIASFKDVLPLIPLRNMVVFPHMIVPLFIGRSKSIKALEETLQKDKLIVFASQKSEEVEDPGPEDISRIGTLAEVVQFIQLPDQTTKILAEGICRVKLEEFLGGGVYLRVKASKIIEEEGMSVEAEGMIRTVVKQFEKYVKLNKKIPPETVMSIINVDKPGHLADLITSYLTLKMEDKQAILETLNVEKRLAKLSETIEKEIEALNVEKELQGKVRNQIDKMQREYYLKEKLKVIQEELGEEEDELQPEISEYRKKIKAAKLPEEVREKAEKELERLSKMPSMLSEASVIRTYLDWLVEMPWKTKTKSKIDIEEVEKALNEDHHGLKKVKERILEYFAVLELTGKIGGSILCLVGPPGVGKTSIASSIARAMGRKFTRMSLGGVRDEAEIRGHRRTYVGSLPGRIIQSIHKVKVNNPVFLLDEVDKIGNDFRGDPASALLEVLDPEQNCAFTDHYMEVPFDLSEVFFITTANTMETVPRPLRDRMEIIPMAGYTEEEKIAIAEDYLIVKELKVHGLEKSKIEFEKEGLRKIVQEFTREAGVRELERVIAKILRKIAMKIVRNKKENKESIIIGKKNIEEYLGAPKYHYGIKEEKDLVGTATGMAWTEVGGDTLPIEVTIMPGKGNLTITGQLGDVMQESAKAALSYVRSKAKQFSLHENFYRKYDFHIHVPEGAVPKDGPSAGITIATALISALTLRPVRRDIAMTGEITLRGKVLPIGGLKEKVLAARRAGITNIIFPADNLKDYNEMKSGIPKDIKVNPVKTMDEVVKLALHPLHGTTKKSSARKRIHKHLPDNRLYA